MVRSRFIVGKLPHPSLFPHSPQRFPDLSGKRTLIILLMFLIAGLWHALPGGAADVPVRLNALSEGGVISKRVKSVRELRLRQVVPQTADYSCGAAALATILRYRFGYQVTEKDAILGMFKLGEKEKIRRRGFSMLDMKRFALSQGLKAQGYRVKKMDVLKKLNVPAITLIKTMRYKHFVVIRRADDRFVYLSDPSWGNRKMPLADFEKYWNRVIMVLLGPCKGIPEGLYSEAADEELPKNQVLRAGGLLGYRLAMDPTYNIIYFTQLSAPQTGIAGILNMNTFR